MGYEEEKLNSKPSVEPLPETMSNNMTPSLFPIVAFYASDEFKYNAKTRKYELLVLLKMLRWKLKHPPFYNKDSCYTMIKDCRVMQFLSKIRLTKTITYYYDNKNRNTNCLKNRNLIEGLFVRKGL